MPNERVHWLSVQKQFLLALSIGLLSLHLFYEFFLPLYISETLTFELLYHEHVSYGFWPCLTIIHLQHTQTPLAPPLHNGTKNFFKNLLLLLVTD